MLTRCLQQIQEEIAEITNEMESLDYVGDEK